MSRQLFVGVLCMCVSFRCYLVVVVCCKPLRLNLKKVYGDQVLDDRTLMVALRTNVAYRTIRTPLRPITIEESKRYEVEDGFTIDVEHRFFLEDVPFGLVVLRDLADLVGIQVPHISEILIWCQELMGKQYLVKTTNQLNGKDLHETGAPKVFGIQSLQQLTQGAHTPFPPPRQQYKPSKL